MFFGYLLLGVIVLKSLLEIWRLTGIRNQNDGGFLLWQIKAGLKLALYVLIAALIVSGLAIYYANFGDTVALSTFKNIHIYSTWGILILAVAYVVTTIFARLNAQNYQAVESEINNSSWVRIIVAVVISVLAVWLVFNFLEKPTTLISKNINRRIALNGFEGIEWTGADSVFINVSGGDNFSGGVSKVKVKSFHSRQNIHFLIEWRDWEPSFNRSLEKTVNGWRELKSLYSPFGESVYIEDQLAILFHSTESGCASSCHLGGSERAGSHYTKSDTADLWMWQAVSTNPAFEMDDGWLGVYKNDSLGGRHYDNSPGGGNTSNLNEEWDEPYFLPGAFQFGNWIWMGSDQYVPYRAGLDNYRIGSTLPARLVTGFSGDRGDLRARGNWRNGKWTVEITRKRNTGSSFDIRFKGQLWMSIAVFNNSELKHAYHLKPIKLVIEE